MKEFVDKFVELERIISNEKGDFVLFALFLREEAPDKWDLVVAAPWIESDRKAALPYLTKQLQAKLTLEELTNLSRIVPIDMNNPAVETMNQAVSVEHGTFEITASSFFGLPLKHAYIVTSRKLSIDAEALAAEKTSTTTQRSP